MLLPCRVRVACRVEGSWERSIYQTMRYKAPLCVTLLLLVTTGAQCLRPKTPLGGVRRPPALTLMHVRTVLVVVQLSRQSFLQYTVGA